MLRENVTAVIARNEAWSGASATEPYEAGWASEAVIFVRALTIKGPATKGAIIGDPAIGDPAIGGPATGDPSTDDPTVPAPAASSIPARVQISADGMRWIDEGTVFPLPDSLDVDRCARVRHFGNWLRIAADLPAGLTMKVLVTLHLK